jgi:hypothetical protein
MQNKTKNKVVRAGVGMGWLRRVAGVALAGALGACGAVDSTIDPRYDTFNRQLERARNEGILLNIVRASHDWPLSFSTISQVNPTLQNVTTLGSPQFLLGPNQRCNLLPSVVCLAVPPSPGRDVVFGNQNNATNATTITTGFTVAPNEDRNFYDALLRPVDLHILSYFIRQGYSRELLFWLFADSIEVGPPARAIGFQYNPPYDFGCNRHDPRDRCMREWAEIAVITGLSVEEVAVDKGTAGGDSGDSSDGGGKGKAKSGSAKSGMVEFARFCFSTVLADRGYRAMDPVRREILKARYLDKGLIFRPRCGEPWDPVRERVGGDILTFTAGPFLFRIVPRSAYAIFQFLGKILRETTRGVEVSEGAYLPREDEALPLLSTIREDERLLNVQLNTAEPCFVDTQFIEGTYCVPERSSANTKHIFSLLSQLIALQTTAADLAITPTVRVVQ